MKKLSIVFALLLMVVLGARAERRDAAQAIAIASEFCKTTPQMQKAGRPAKAPAFSLLQTKIVAQGDNYYLCSVGGDNIVVVSADDRFRSVLGYSANADAEQEMPDGLKYWLEFLDREMQAAIEAGYEPARIKTNLIALNPAHSVEPMLETRWSQGQPYNNKLNGYMTGCVATGTAQVMNYWKYPVRGTGSHTGGYAPNYSADFGNTTYDWAHMLPCYGYDPVWNPTGGLETKAQIEAVSTLMLHLGVATDMRWGKQESGTPSAYAAYALHNFFNYNENLYIENRDQLSLGAWKSVIIDQLQTGHPLCFSGMSTETGGVGHFFVCDGYDAESGKFHFNWGWNGMYDGYYDMSSLEPGTGGIGAGMGSFNYWQCIFVNVQPTLTGEYQARFDARTVKFSATDKSAVRATVGYLANNNTYDFKGSCGVAVYKTDGSLLKYCAAPNNFPEAGLHIGASYSGDWYYTASLADIPNGTYTVCAAVWSNKHEKVYPIRAKFGNPTYYTMVVNGSKVTFTPKTDAISLTMNSISLATNAEGNVFQNHAAKFLISLTNNSDVDFNDEIGVYIYSSFISEQLLSSPVQIAAGETKTISVIGIIDPEQLDVDDDYDVDVMVGINGTFSQFIAEEVMTVNVKDEASGVNDIKAKDGNNDGVSFNLSGQRVSNSAKGIIIKNGNKTINR